MNDVVILQITSSVFWLIIFGVIVWIFRQEVRKLLQSLGGVKVAGSSFEFKDQKETIESYVLLAETLIDILSRSDRIEAMLNILVPSQVERLSAFAIRYTEEVPKESWNEELLRNIAYLLLRFGRYIQSITLYDALLDGRPNHSDLLNLKALAMITSRLPEQVGHALPILSSLVDRYPESSVYRYNYALACSLAAEHQVALKEMEFVIRSPYVKMHPGVLQDPLFHKTRDSEPEEIQRLDALLRSELQSSR